MRTCQDKSVPVMLPPRPIVMTFWEQASPLEYCCKPSATLILEFSSLQANGCKVDSYRDDLVRPRCSGKTMHRHLALFLHRVTWRPIKTKKVQSRDIVKKSMLHMCAVANHPLRLKAFTVSKWSYRYHFGRLFWTDILWDHIPNMRTCQDREFCQPHSCYKMCTIQSAITSLYTNQATASQITSNARQDIIFGENIDVGGQPSWTNLGIMTWNLIVNPLAVCEHGSCKPVLTKHTSEIMCR